MSSPAPESTIAWPFSLRNINQHSHHRLPLQLLNLLPGVSGEPISFKYPFKPIEFFLQFEYGSYGEKGRYDIHRPGAFRGSHVRRL